MKPPKKVKAWAVVDNPEGDNIIFVSVFHEEARMQACGKNERVIPVLITPLSERGK